MADEQPATQPPAAEAKDLHTDPVTGEKISKSELKRRQKQREKDEKKKEKAAALPVQPKKEKKDNVEELNPNVRYRFPSVCWLNYSHTAAILRDPIQQD
jgi:lysyl-tRNA synthetase class 2